MPLYSCIDVRLESDLALPELHPATDPQDIRPVVTVRRASLPDVLPDAPDPSARVQAANGCVQFTVPGVARYRIVEGRSILVDPIDGGSTRDLRLFLLGSALGLLCHQRGNLPLHANAMLAGDGAFAFAGPSGAGKSTLAAHFRARGYPVLCDDVCLVSFADDGTPLAWPGLPRLKLWGDAAAAFGHDKATLDVAVEGLDKYHVPMEAAARPTPAPLRRLYVLSRAPEGQEGRIERLRGQAAMRAVMGNTYRGQTLAKLGLSARHFSQCAALLERIEVYAASRAWGYDSFEREAARLERHVSEFEVEAR